MRRIGVVTTSRADYGIYLPLLKALGDEPRAELMLYVGGMHLAPEFGSTVERIEADGWPIAARVECIEPADTGLGTAVSMSRALAGFARALVAARPDILVVLGDRFEMSAAALAALPLGIPVAHLFGGELTAGAQDDALRHAMTKLSHLHFTATEEYARRVIQLGEEPQRVTVCGALSLDNLAQMKLMSRDELGRDLGLDLAEPPILVTYHPVTLEPGQAKAQMGELLAALEGAGRPVVFTLPNADAGGRELAALVHDFAEEHPWAAVRDNLGTLRYFSLMACAAAMAGNSSSGIIEAGSFGLPVVNIGRRQEGRLAGANVLHVTPERGAIAAGLARALSPGFQAGLADAANPYQAGGAAEIIVNGLLAAELGPGLLIKRFHDLESTPGE